MGSSFRAIAGSTIPILGWKFLRSDKEAARLFTPRRWRGWQSHWRAIATTETGDAIVIAGGRVYQVEHGTGLPVVLGKPIAPDVKSLEALLKCLKNFLECSAEDSLTVLRVKRDRLRELKKSAPRPLKYHFDAALSESTDLIADARWNSSRAGKMQAYVEANHQSWEASISKRWKVIDLMIRRCGEDSIGVAGAAAPDDIPSIMKYLAKHVRCPVKNLLR
jgi:hypothetical protein